MTDKQIKLDGSFIPIEEAIKAGLISENDIKKEQIIIDGCDVSGCEWIREVGLDSEYICTCNSPNKTSGYCKYNPNCRYKQLKAKEQECERLKEAIKTKTGKDYINEIQDITMKYECHQKSMGVCWWGKYGKETKCIGIRECHKRELEVIQNLEEIILQAIKDFSLEYGTPQYDRLLNGAKSLGIEVKKYE